MSVTPDELRERSKKFALRIIRLYRRLYRALPRGTDAQVMGKQLLCSGTSVAANYRAACRSRSRAEFASRMAVVMEEANESVFWLGLLCEPGVVRPARMTNLLQEAHELTAIFTASQYTARNS